MDTLKGLSIQQPWIDMILRGVKTLELRAFEVRDRGMVALHAPMRIDYSAAYFYGYQEPWLLPRQGVLAVAEISDVWELDAESWIITLDRHRQPLPFAGGVYGIRLENVRRLRRRVDCKGRPGLFSFPPAVASQVFANLGV
jgi:hypothetical protein